MAQRVNQSSYTYAAGAAAALGCRFLLNVIVARSSGPEQMGLYLSMVLMPMLLGRFLDLSLSHAMVYYVRREPLLMRKAFRLLVLHGIAAYPFAILLVLGLGFLPFEDLASSMLVREHYLALSGIVVLSSFTGSVAVLFLVTKRQVIFGLLSCVSSVSMVSLILLGVQADNTAAELVRKLLAAEGIAAACAVLTCLLFAKSSKPPSSVRARDFYVYGAKAHLGVVGKVVSTRLDRVIVTLILGPAELAVYSIAISYRDMIQTPANLYSTLFQSKLIDRVRAGQAVLPLVRRQVALWFIGMLAAFVVTILAIDFILREVYGPAFANGGDIVAIVSLSAAFFVPAGLIWSVMHAIGAPHLFSIALISAGTVSVGLVLLLSEGFGIQGAAVATTLSGLASVVIAAVVLVRSKRFQDLQRI